MKSNNSIGQFCFLLIHRKKQKRTGLKDAKPIVSTPEPQSPEGLSGLNGEDFSKEETAIWERLFR